MNIIWNNEDYLMHYGVPRKSGRYKWGSGEDPYHHGASAPRRLTKKIERKERRIEKRTNKINKINDKLNRPLSARALRKEAKFKRKAGKRARAHNRYERKYIGKGKTPSVLNPWGQHLKRRHNKYVKLTAKANKYEAKTERKRTKRDMLQQKNVRTAYKIKKINQKISKIEKKHEAKAQKKIQKVSSAKMKDIS